MVPGKDNPDSVVELEGTPDLVVEIVSSSSVGKDTRRLKATYFQVGIPEYWLIDARGDEIAFDLLMRRKSGFAAVPVRDGWRRSRVLGRDVRLERTRNRIGQWQHRLQLRNP